MPADAKLLAVGTAICSARALILGSEVGSGAFKHTFEVTVADGSSRALKLYRKAGADARTQREVDAITRCSHQGVARFELIGTWRDGSDDYIYSIEEFLAGGTLTARLAAGALARCELMSLGNSLIDSVGHIASLDLVHRDLKPDNIMFRAPGGPPVIVDFGLVRDLSLTSLTGTWLPQGPGTPFYSSPEQLNNEKAMIDWRTDQFALGVVLSFCSYGKHPYALPSQTPVQTVDRVARREPPAPEFVVWASTNKLVPLAQMVEPWPVARYRTAQQLAKAWQTIGAL